MRAHYDRTVSLTVHMPRSLFVTSHPGDAQSATSQVGANYILGGVLLILAGIMEFVSRGWQYDAFAEAPRSANELQTCRYR